MVQKETLFPKSFDIKSHIDTLIDKPSNSTYRKKKIFFVNLLWNRKYDILISVS